MESAFQGLYILRLIPDSHCPEGKSERDDQQMEADLTIRADDLREATLAQLKALRDEELFRHMQAGNHDALAVLFDRYHHTVLGIARKILKDAGEAEDLMQVVFFELFQTAAQFDPAKGSSRAWIIRCAYHRALNRKQYLKVRAFYGQGEVENSRAPELVAHGAVTAGLKEPEVRRLVHEGLQMLNEAQRKTLTLAFLEGLSLAEIADRLNESLVNVRHHYYRGLQKLRSFLFEGAQGKRKE
jgi:RNA polymerase sigma-70 factor (ECF subfamily)